MDRVELKQARTPYLCQLESLSNLQILPAEQSLLGTALAEASSSPGNDARSKLNGGGMRQISPLN